jgi:hypothetical protein
MVYRCPTYVRPQGNQSDGAGALLPPTMEPQCSRRRALRIFGLRPIWAWFPGDRRAFLAAL